MSFKERIVEDLKNAMKSGDRQTVSTLRMVRAKILNKEVSLRTLKGKNYQLSDKETLDVISSYAKQCHQSLDSYRNGGRHDLVAKEEEELRILQLYLPKQLSKKEIEVLLDQIIEKTGAVSLRDIGPIMKALMIEIAGAADGKFVSKIVQRRLTGQEKT